jgi:glucosamine--fructose-6-phosphate aminotransferase (isomerizing)
MARRSGQWWFGQMKPTVMLDNIRNQPLSLGCVADRQFGEGAADMHAAAAAIRSAGSVVFTGMGSSMSAAIPAAYYLESHGFAAQVVETSEWLHFGAAWPRAGAVVLVSRSGETIEIVKLLPRVEASPTVGVTNERESQLARETDHAIYIGSQPDRMVAIQTYTGTMATLLLLAAAVLNEDGAKSRAALDGAAAALSVVIDETIAQSEQWNEFLAGAEVVHLLGRGPSLASVREGALLFNEAARTPSTGMSCALFRHGPVEIVDARFRAVVFASQAPSREIDLALASDLERLGGKVRVFEARGVPSPFEPMIEIVAIQIAACGLAESKGIDPGDFRYATLVTLAETGFEKS